MRDIKGNNNKNVIHEGDTVIEGDNRGNVVYGTQIINNHANKQDEIQYKVNRGKMILNRKHISKAGGTLTIGGFLGIVSNIITIVQGIGSGQITESSTFIIISNFSFLLGCGLIYFSSVLKRKKIFTFFPSSIFGFNMVLVDNHVIKVKIKGVCPKPECGGELNFFYNREEDKYYFICSRNSSQHRFEFDFTSLKY